MQSSLGGREDYNPWRSGGRALLDEVQRVQGPQEGLSVVKEHQGGPCSRTGVRTGQSCRIQGWGRRRRGRLVGPPRPL